MKKILSIFLFAVILSLSAFAAETVNLTAFPDESTIISTPRYDGVSYPADIANGIYGTKAQIAADINEARVLTEEEQADISNIEYGISAIGVRNFGRANALRNLVDGNWAGANARMCYLRFDDNMYDVNGNVCEDGKYRALFTLNFSTTHRFDACGFISGTQAGMINAADIYVSDDGVNWTIVPTACYDGINYTAYTNLGPTGKDPYNGNTSAYAVLFDMNGATGKYVRLAIAVGRSNTYENYNNINTRELVVYGTPKSLGDINLDGETTVPEVFTILKSIINLDDYNTYMDTNGDEAITLLDVIRIVKAMVTK